VSDIFLTQTEADTLLGMQKIRANNDEHDYPWMGGKISLHLLSVDKKENFLLDVWRSGSIELKGRYQNRARSVIALARLDFGGPPHRNPDDSEISSPHIHLYREGFGDKWAYPLPAEHFTNIDDLWTTLHDFMTFCNVTQLPNILRGVLV
jgi:hypothetical protein